MAFTLSITLSLVLFIFSLTLKSIFAHIIVPCCALPVIKSTDFCAIVITQHFGPANTKGGSLCGIPVAGRFLCRQPRQDVPPTALSRSFNDQFATYQKLVASSSATPVFGKEIRDMVLSLDDMTVLLKATSLRNKDAIISHLALIRSTSRESARRLQKYTSKLLSSINLILTASDFAIEAAQTATLDQHSWVPWSISRPDPQQLQDAFLHTIKTFETLNRHLTHLNGETQEAIALLDASIEVLVDLIYDDTLVNAHRELGDILGRLWTQLGGHRAKLQDVRERIRTLERVGQGSRHMRAFVLDVELQLERLQTGAEELRAQATEPLLIHSPIPIVNVVQSLKEGCTLLRTELWSSTSHLTLGG